MAQLGGYGAETKEEREEREARERVYGRTPTRASETRTRSTEKEKR